MSLPELQYAFRGQAARIIDSGQATALTLTGNVHDLFYLHPQFTKEEHGRYVSLVDHLHGRWGGLQGRVLVTCKLNGSIRFVNAHDESRLANAWVRDRTGKSPNDLAIDRLIRPRGGPRKEESSPQDEFANLLSMCEGRPAAALEFLRELCRVQSDSAPDAPLANHSLLILIESADMIVPAGEITRLSEKDRHRVALCRDWFSDPAFFRGDNAVLLLCESASRLNARIVSLPQVLNVDIEAPDEAGRLHFIEWFDAVDAGDLHMWGTKGDLAQYSAGLSLHALHQLLKDAAHDGREIQADDIIKRVEKFIESQLGEGVVEFKRPTHTLDDIIGFSALKKFARKELIPGFQSNDPESALSGAAVAGPIGSGKTFFFEGVASELGMLVLVLKGIRSKWFGETDLILERLHRVLKSLSKVMIFMDEADTLLGGVGADAHPTERRATGKIQSWMSDTTLLGKVVWLLMTARIHLLSPDIRRPGRVGDLIIPVYDPAGDDREAFIRWTLKAAVGRMPPQNSDTRAKLDDALQGYSAAAYAALRRKLKRFAKRHGGKVTPTQVIEYVGRQRLANISLTRRYQLLQALVNCTDTALLPDPEVTPEEVQAWEDEIRQLEMRGIG